MKKPWTQRVCINCGDIFLVKRTKRKLCIRCYDNKKSKLRYKKRPRKSKILISKNCSDCGGIFYSKTIKPKLCKSCQRKLYKGRYRQRYKIICEICGKKTYKLKYRHNKKARTCSVECLSRLISQISKEHYQKKIILKKCDVCEKKIKVSIAALFKNKQRFCSIRCGKRNSDRRDREILGDRYIYNLIVGKTGGSKTLLKREDIPIPLIEAKRLQIKLLRYNARGNDEEISVK